MAGTSADSNSPWQVCPREVCPRTVTVLCKGRNIFLKFAADNNKPVKARPWTITVRGRHFRRLLRTHFYEVLLYLPAKVIGLGQDR